MPGEYCPGMWTQGRKRCVLTHAFFKSDLTLPRPPPLLLQDSGVRLQDHGRVSGRCITAVLICGPGIVASGVRPQGATAMPTKVSSRVSCCIFLALVYVTLPRQLSQDAEEQPQEHDHGTKSRPLGGEGLVAVSDSQGGGKGDGQPGGRRTKETSGWAERMQREHDNSSTAMGFAPVEGGGQADGCVL